NNKDEIINSSAPFLSRKVWNHIGLEINLSEQLISFYSDGIIFVKYHFSDVPQINDIIISFGNNSLQPFTIEQLRILKPKNEALKIIEDARYISSSLKDAEPVLQLNFDTLNELTNPKNIQSLKHHGIKFVNSNAPIFSRAPELNINITSAYMQLDWISPDANNAALFIVEKSSEEKGFIEIGTITATSENSNVYSYIDAADMKNKILYYRIKQINKDGSVVYSSQVKVGVGSIDQFKLNQNYPNPFNPLTSIELDLFEDSEIEIIIYNIEGQELAVLQKGFLTKGIHKFAFDAGNLPSGVYLYKVSSPVFSQTKKMLLTK
ncbi:MAG: T9SS type A sorting domain-containing protein, partial [Ignavibacteriaceae bacterium]|nr:T9SS type A sorting domain-containing protein [Ignavibacteriaceae bacterium]